MFSRTALAGVLAVLSLAQVYTPGPQVLTFLSDVDDTDQPYALYVPKHFDPQKKYPLVVSLHGEYSNHRLNLRRVFGRANRMGETAAEAPRYWRVFRDVKAQFDERLASGMDGADGFHRPVAPIE